MEERKTITVIKPSIAHKILQAGYRIVDVRPFRNEAGVTDYSRCVFLFEYDKEIYKIIDGWYEGNGIYLNETKDNGYTRRMSLEENFMHYSIDDLLFASMVYFATYDPITKRLYLSKKNYGKHRKEIATLCDCTTRALRDHLKKLLSNNLVEETDILGEHGDTIPSYTFPYDVKDKYQIVNNEMLWYVINTRNKQGVKVYSYLLNKFIWKRQTGEKYVFTNREIISALGYISIDYGIISSMITNLLKSFCREGVIQITKFHEIQPNEYGNPVPVPRMGLEFVAEEIKQLKPIDI